MNIPEKHIKYQRFHRRLSHISDGKRCRIVKIISDIAIKQYNRRIHLAPGTIIKVEGRGPFGSPIRISLGGKQIMIGLNSAQMIIVEPLD